ncbi:M28 family metallopeptidase [Streptomyces zingiberis]|uniref:M20/M25/M40 family metallo-hydrolase n=1 Tax=Streptomyces zingiberis TaxID=2053010 RepID=A0ABX1BN36_9ACTN|nr:M28 family metallopeptidase [Streptomyces zingiberis]NJP99143.1 M20/M25/M40 family metallo-hydrolase [Streptomyces zingiberis]
MAALAATALATPLLLAAASPAAAKPDPGRKAQVLAKKLVTQSSAKSAHSHLKRFQAIADANDGHRAAGSPGYDASAAYVYQLLKKAGYQVSYNTFDFVYTETLAEKLSVLSPNARDVEVAAMTYTTSTPEGGIEAAVAAVPVDADGTTGCTSGDYAGQDFTGKIALIQRGGCTFGEKQAAAADAGAEAAIIYNNTDGALNGTLGDAAVGRIPTGGITQQAGEALAAEVAQGEVRVAYEIRALQEDRTTSNVIAETKGGKAADTVMLGAHLDSVAEGPGINDNGSGSAGLLEVALKLAKTNEKPANKVRFAWWSAEELGLQGSERYVAGLTDAQREQIRLYLNFDMIASPNYGLFVYDGDDSDGVGAGPGPEGSAQLERQITDFLDKRGIPHAGTDFTGRSDYGPFIEVGIPSGGTFTGAEGIKTEKQAEMFGGEAGVAYDPCYHQACDDLSNIDMKAFDVNIDIIANAVGTYAHDLSPLTRTVETVPTDGDAGSGGGLHDGHADHRPTE